MQEWEHKVEVAAGGGQFGIVNAPIIQEVLEREQQGGWELVTALNPSGSQVVWLIFKRVKPDQ
jgi:hypothetical protein